MVKITGTKALLVFVVILVVIQTGVILYFSNTIISLEQELNSTKTELHGKINENYIQTQDQLDKLTSSLIQTEQSLTKQLSQIKATTSADFSGIIEEAVKSVVSIKTDVGQGSGFIISEEGYIVTNAHVLAGANYARALTYENKLVNAEPIGYDPNADLALLKIEGGENYLKLGNSDNLRVGEKVIAVGNPYGLSFSVSEGIVSAIDRKYNNIEAYIQTDVALNPGNSGGPLINNKGEVVGINNFKVGGAEGLGFALESNYIEQVINNIAEQVMNKTIV